MAQLQTYAGRHSRIRLLKPNLQAQTATTGNVLVFFVHKILDPIDTQSGDMHVAIHKHELKILVASIFI